MSDSAVCWATGHLFNCAMMDDMFHIILESLHYWDKPLLRLESVSDPESESESDIAAAIVYRIDIYVFIAHASCCVECLKV